MASFKNTDKGADVRHEELFSRFREHNVLSQKQAELLELCSTFFQVFRLENVLLNPFSIFFNHLLCAKQVGRETGRKMKIVHLRKHFSK